MNNKTDIDVKYVSPLKKICMTIGELPSSYLETMSYYEMLVWFTEFLKNQVIPTINNNAEAVQELQSLYEELRTYVNDYFDNLDVQDEINNKLEAMAESGQLTDIIAQYLGLAGMITFDTVAEMKLAQNLVNGSKCRTLGFYSVNDGGGATYKIRTITNDDTVDECTILEVYDNLLIAELIIENETINALQIGIKRNDNTFDSHTKLLNIVQNFNYKLFFPKGTYYISETFFNKDCHVNLLGESNCYEYNTIFEPYGSNNGYIIKCGGKSDYSVDSTTNLTLNQLKNIKINGISFRDWTNNLSDTKYSYYACLVIDNCSDIELNTNFIYCNSNGLLIRDSWELQSNYISCRGMYGDFDTCGILFANRSLNGSGSTSQISSMVFNLLDFEQINGKCIITETSANCSNISINQILLENGRSAYVDLKSQRVAYITTSELDTYRSTYSFNPLLQFKGIGITINSISTGSCCNCYYYKDGVQADGKWTDVILDVAGSIGIGQIAMPGVMTGIITNNLYTEGNLETVTISSFKSIPNGLQTSYGNRIPAYIYIIPNTLSSRDGTTYIDILDKTIVVNPDYVHEIGTGFYNNMEMYQFVMPKYGITTYGIVDNNYCINMFYARPDGGLMNNVKVEAGKKIRFKTKLNATVVGNVFTLVLLDETNTVVESIESSVRSWTPNVWDYNEFTIPSTSYHHLDLKSTYASAIEWIEIV